MNQENKKKKHNRVKILLIILTVLLVVLSVGYFYLQSKLNLINRTTPTAVILPEEEYFEADEDTTVDASKDTEVDPDDVVWPVDEDFMKDKDIINILLIGQDRRPGEQRARSDSMMIATINKKNNTVSITSLMRDMYVQIPGYSDNRINAAYAFGGMELLDATIEKNFLVHIDGNIEVDFNGFQQAIDKIGGVDISINAKEADYLNKNGFTGLSEGTVYMDGKLALTYSRIRKVGNNDYERTERQRKVILTVFQKMKGLRFDEIIGVFDVIFPLVTTDLTNNELISLSYTIFLMNTGDIGTYRIPSDDSFTSAKIRGMSVLVPDLSENRKVLKNIIYGE